MFFGDCFDYSTDDRDYSKISQRLTIILSLLSSSTGKLEMAKSPLLQKLINTLITDLDNILKERG